MELFKLFGTIAINGTDEAKKDINDTTETAEQSENRMSSAFKKIGAAVATYFAVDKIVDFGKSIVNASAEVSAEVSAFEQIMGNYSDNAQKKLNEIADQTGMVSSRLTPYMTSLTAKFKGLGYDIDEATTLASDGLSLAADASAFWDKSLEDAMGGLNSFINGSYEGGEAIGLFANDTQLASYAVKNGIVKETKEWSSLDEARKQATRLDYAKKMFEMSGATGQASKEADQYANVQANLIEKWRQFKAQIGEPLLQNIVIPAMNKLSGVVDKLSKGFNNLTKWISENKDTVKIAVGVFASATAGLLGYKAVVLGMSIINSLKTWLNGATLAQKLLNLAMKANPIGIVIGLVTSLVAAFIYFWNTSEGFRNFVLSLWETIKTTFNGIVQSISDAWERVKTSTEETWNGIVTWLQETWNGFVEFFSNLWTSVVNTFTGVWDSIVGVCQTAWEYIKSIVSIGVQLIGQIINFAIDVLLIPWNFIWQNFGTYLVQAWEWLKNIVNTGINFISNIISNVMNGIYNSFMTIWNAIYGFISNILTNIWNFYSRIFNQIWTVVSTVFNNVKNFIVGVWNAIYSFVSEVVTNIYNWIGDKFNQVKTTVSNIFNSIKTTATNIWNGIKNTISSVIDSIKNTVSNVFNSVSSSVSNIFNGIKSTATSVWNSIKSAITKPVEAAKNTVKNLIDKIKGFFNFSWSLPKLKLPHISIKGEFSLMPPKVPSFGIEWYKDGGIMTQPTLFGMNPFTQKAMVGGEAGPEAIAPISTLSDYVKIAVKEENEGLIYYIQKMIEMLNDYLEQIVNNIDRPIVLEDGTLVSKLAPQIDQKLGDINKGRGRGR